MLESNIRPVGTQLACPLARRLLLLRAHEGQGRQAGHQPRVCIQPGPGTMQTWHVLHNTQLTIEVLTNQVLGLPGWIEGRTTGRLAALLHAVGSKSRGGGRARASERGYSTQE